MATMALEHDQPPIKDPVYRQRIRAWTMYDWANSAFATTILAAFLPVYYSSVAGATLPSEATATAYWSVTLSFSLFLIAIFSPILGTISDVMRGKKRFLTIFIGIGVVGTGLLVLVNTGDWFLASLFFVIGRIGFSGSIIFYDALLPHVAKPEDQDRVSTTGFAMGYLGGGLLLVINVLMFQFIPDTVFENAGARLSFLTVALWWALFSIPILRQVPEPPSASADLAPGETVLGVSWRRLRQTFRDLRQYSELFKYLVAFLIYNDAIGTIIGVAAIYGAELGFGTLELILALVLVQFAGIPFSLIFGSLPDKKVARRHQYLAFIVFNAVMLPTVALIGRFVLPADITGSPPPPYETTNGYYGEGVYGIASDAFSGGDDWQTVVVTGDEQVGEGALASFLTIFTGIPDDVTYARTTQAGAAYEFQLNGQEARLTYSVGPDHGRLAIFAEGTTAAGETLPASSVPVLLIDMYQTSLRYNESTTLTLDEPGQYTLRLVNLDDTNEASTGSLTSLARLTVLQPIRESALPLIIGLLFALQAVGVVFALAFGRYFQTAAKALDTRRSILLSLFIYGMIATWGFVLDTTIEFWFLAWMVAIVQGGSQALSRSLYASLSPASKSGEFFGLYAIMEKFAAILGPLVFALAVALFDSSRPAILSLIVFFIIGGYLLTRVDIEAGQRYAREEDAAIIGAQSA